MEKKIEGTGKWLIKRWGVVSKEMKKDIERVEQEAERRGLERALEITKEAVKVGQGLRKNAVVYGLHEEVGLLICGVENEIVKLLEKENGKTQET